MRAAALDHIEGGLRAVSDTLLLPGQSPLKDAHRALDEAVIAAYGFQKKKSLLAQLFALNAEVAERIAASKEVTGPGLPPGIPVSTAVLSTDRIG